MRSKLFMQSKIFRRLALPTLNKFRLNYSRLSINYGHYQHDGYNSNWNWQYKYILIAPAITQIVSEQKNDEEEDNKIGVAWCSGYYTFTQNDINGIFDYLASTGEIRRTYPDAVQDTKQKGAYRKFIASKKWKTNVFRPQTLNIKVVYREVEELYDLNNSKQIKLTKENKERPNVTSVFSRKRLAPETDLQSIWTKYHIDSGHNGINRTIQNIGDKFWIYNLCAFVQDYIALCEICTKKNNNNKKKYRAPLNLVSTPTQPLSEWSIDLFGPVSTSHLGHKYGLVVKGLVTRYTKVIPVISKNAPDVADPLHNKITLPFGGSYRFHSDNGLEFVNNLDNFCAKVYNYRRTTIHPGCPWQNPAESGVKVIKSNYNILLKKICDKAGLVFNKKKWPAFWCDISAEVEYLTNLPKNTVTKMSPFKFAFNKDPYFGYTPSEMEGEIQDEKKAPLSVDQLVKGYLERATRLSAIARSSIKHRKKQIKTAYDKRVATDLIPIGTRVKWKERGEWLPKEGCVYIKGYTKRHKARLYDNMNSLVITIGISELRPALKHERLIVYSPSKFDKGKSDKNIHSQKENESESEMKQANESQNKSEIDDEKNMDIDQSQNKTEMDEEPSVANFLQEEIEQLTVSVVNKKIRSIHEANDEIPTEINELKEITNTHGLKRSKNSYQSLTVTKKFHSKRRKKKR
eukprot:98413_1